VVGFGRSRGGAVVVVAWRGWRRRCGRCCALSRWRARDQGECGEEQQAASKQLSAGGETLRTAGGGQTETRLLLAGWLMSEAHRAAAWYVTYVLVIAAANSGYSAEAERPTCATRQRGTTANSSLRSRSLKAPQDSPSSVLVQTPLQEAFLTSGEAG
jgi:hypothetical protein